MPAQAVTPGLNAFEQGVKYGNHKAAQAVGNDRGNEAAPTPARDALSLRSRRI